MSFFHEIMKESVGTHWTTLYASGDNVTYFDSFRVEHIPQEIKKIISNKNITTNNYRIRGNDLVNWSIGVFVLVLLIL